MSDDLSPHDSHRWSACDERSQDSPGHDARHPADLRAPFPSDELSGPVTPPGRDRQRHSAGAFAWDAPTAEADDVRDLLARTPDGPPLELTAPDVIALGARIRRRRKRWAVAGKRPAATVAVLALAGFAVGHRPAPPVEPAGPGLSTVAPSGTSRPAAPPAATPTRLTPTDAPRQAPGAPPRTRPTTETPPRAPRTPSDAPPSATNLPSAPESAPSSPLASGLPTATRR